mgnify:FL=1
MRNLLITISYDGSAYHGWQVQKNAVTVQQVFQKAVEKLFRQKTDIKGCSRTDSGVHAKMYCVSIKTQKNIPCENIITGLNTYLPKDIAVTGCIEVADDFHARYSVKSKEYVYRIYNSQIRNPFLKNYALHYRYPIDAQYLNEEAQAFLGSHDFSGFCSAKSDVEDTVRTVYSFSVTRNGDEVIFSVEADGFLYNMVRIMVGTLLFVNEGKIKQGELADVIKSKDRKRAGKTAPAHGLYLNNVKY